MGQWHWQTAEDATYLTCDLLQDWKHGFFSQRSWPKTPQALTQLLTPQAEVYRVKQVHGNVVLKTADLTSVSEGAAADSVAQAANVAQSDAGQPFAEADGILATGANQSVWACSADCTPALLGDVKTGMAAAVHAGWRGTAAKILPEAVELLMYQGSRLEDLRVALGPAIAGQVYQVDEATALKVGATVMENASDNALLMTLQGLADPPILPDAAEGKVRLDVRRINILQLIGLGLSAEQLSVAPHCTYQEPEQFFSYRRTGEKKVQWSGIVSQG